MADIVFYDLDLDGKGAWSPNTCKTRYALNVKRIPYETVWLSFPEIRSTIPGITKTDKRPTVPIIVDKKHDDRVVQDSWLIAKYLEEAYPDAPSLFHGNEGVHYFYHNYVSSEVLPKIFRLCVLGVHSKAQPESVRDWFRKDREAMFKMSLEEFAGNEQEHINALDKALAPLGDVLNSYPYLTGDRVGWADVVTASYFTFLIRIRPDLFEPIVFKHAKAGDAFRAWWGRMEKYMQDKPPAPDARM